ncbi:outer membrane beta-barrel family protein [Flammeovirga kamogawensis]|uniref:TonB-dependent receptor n=1 Tax=Flammeovirga kamogawensis TaxID=373891 RepID=A0ABX8GR51_9BACT|nr:outer membrane beta-barrel family protein [Flammeovirga kamogawensis]MBB6462002.1 outer membrane receptor protein involved in Fe transport [Flammeovirga kamogawensis]QWG05742.1 TonB-dependent receptor [Flammeovirga kamogawensis]TRX67568.1 TonB-dependent receptor [Flammeovirga kamogawensis]
MNLIKLSLILISNFFFIGQSFDSHAAEKKGQIIGGIINAQTSEAVGYATVSVLDNQGKIIGGVLSGDKGNFTIKDVYYGTYELRIQFIGYEMYKKVIVVDKSTLNIGTVKLAVSTKQLDEVVIQGDKMMIERTIDKNIVNVTPEQASGNSVSEFLNKIPEISVDSQGKISLRGESNVKILIDGKMSQMDITQVLQSLPASSIDKIEVITNPSAKYDPEGLSGIINIITKKNTMEGFNVGLYTEVGSRQKNNNYVGLNYRVKKFNFFASGNYGANRNEFDGTLDRTNYENNSVLRQDIDKVNRGEYHKIKVGTDYFLDSTNVITFYFEQNKYETTQNVLTRERSEYDVLDRSYLSSKEDSYTFSLNHQKQFKKGSLETDITLNTGEFDLVSNVNDDYSNLTGGNFTFQAYKVDYSQAINDKSAFDVGIHSQTIGANLLMDIKNPIGNNGYNYDYRESINSAYSSYSLKLGKFSMKAGLRAEMVNISADIIEDGKENYTIDYKSLFPSLHLRQQLNDHNNLGLSYSRRIQRPKISQLLPIEIAINPVSILVGNPELQPSYTNSISMDHSFYKNKFSFTTSVYFRHSTDVITSIANFDNERNITVNSYENLGVTKTGGLSLSSNYQIVKWWKIDGGINVFYLDVQDETYTIPGEKSPFNFSGKLNSSITLPKGFVFNLSGRYASIQYNAQVISDTNYALGMSIQKRILKNRGTLTLKVDDFVNSGFGSTVYGDGFEDRTYTLGEVPIYKISFNYDFGGQFKGRKNRKLHTKGGLN